MCPDDRPVSSFGGWTDSAAAYIAAQDQGDVNRTLLLDPVMLRLCGDIDGARVLDVGCGEGRFARMLSGRGAHVVGIDPIPRMLASASSRGDESYARAVAEQLPFADASFDMAISYVTLVDIPGYREAIGEIARVLRPGGALVVANLGFVTAGYGWHRDADGTRLHQKIDRYAEEWSQVYEWAGIRIENWHRPLSAYMQAYLGAGLALRAFEEPVPDDDSLREHYQFEDWFRVPLFNVMRWEK